MRKTVLPVLAIAVVLSPAVTFTQGGKAKPTTATYITKEEVDIVNKTGPGIDRNIKVVDIGPEHVDYLSFRPSPGILTAGWVHPVLRK